MSAPSGAAARWFRPHQLLPDRRCRSGENCSRLIWVRTWSQTSPSRPLQRWASGHRRELLHEKAVRVCPPVATAANGTALRTEPETFRQLSALRNECPSPVIPRDGPSLRVGINSATRDTAAAALAEALGAAAGHLNLREAPSLRLSDSCADSGRRIRTPIGGSSKLTSADRARCRRADRSSSPPPAPAASGDRGTGAGVARWRWYRRRTGAREPS